MIQDEAWVTLATNDTYALGALVLAESLNRVKSSRKRVVMVTPTVTPAMRTALAHFYHSIQDVDVINSPDAQVLALTKRPELGVTLTKIHCWSLTQFKKCVFLDADTLVLQPCDELFERDELSAVCDIGWPDCFNSGVFVFKPSMETFHSLVSLAGESSGTFDGGDQGLLNQYFSRWFSGDRAKHLSFIYNMTLTTTYTYAPAFKKYGVNVKIVHFLGPLKPWLHTIDSQTGQVMYTHGPSESREVNTPILSCPSSFTSRSEEMRSKQSHPRSLTLLMLF